MMNTTVIQSNVPKLKEKKNFWMWDLWIRSLLASQKKLAAIEYVLKLKSFINKKDLADTTAETLAETECLRKAGIMSPDQHVKSSDIRAEEVSLSPEPGISTVVRDDEVNKSDDSWCYHKNNNEVIFTLIFHLADHILMKIQDIQSVKLMYD